MSDENKAPETAAAHNGPLTGAVDLSPASAPLKSNVGKGLGEAWVAFQSIEDLLKDILASRSSVTSDRLQPISGYVKAGKAGIIKAKS